MHIILYQPEIPQNTGNIGRTCVAVGAKLWLVRPLGFQLDTHHLRRAGLDYWEHLQWEAVDTWSDLVGRLGDVTMWFFTRRGSRLYTDVRYSAHDALVFGSESAGLPGTILQQNEAQRLRIPTAPQVRSLNVSNAVAVAAYECLRQTSYSSSNP